MNEVSSSKKVIVLDNIRSVYNVGSIFRTADAAGVHAIYLCGTTPAPRDRFGRMRKDLAKVALGAELSVKWETYDCALEAISILRKDNFEIVSVEQNKNSINYREFKILKDTAFVFGSETEGVNTEILKKSDKTIEIPMLGEKESLNVSVAVGIILFSV
jgi:23S rRNA (guanosine2251-2'-O)-methyltransferase